MVQSIHSRHSDYFYRGCGVMAFAFGVSLLSPKWQSKHEMSVRGLWRLRLQREELSQAFLG